MLVLCLGCFGRFRLEGEVGVEWKVGGGSFIFWGVGGFKYGLRILKLVS